MEQKTWLNPSILWLPIINYVKNEFKLLLF